MAPYPQAPIAVVGLGNPGAEYAATRHNIGFRVIDRLRQEDAENASRTAARRWNAETVETNYGWLLKPLTYMNASGEAVADMAEELGLSPERILVVTDDVHLPLGRMRLRFSGSCGGHNGLASIERELAADTYPRLRLGVGQAGKKSLIDHVLGAFDATEEELVEVVVEQATHAVRLWINSPAPGVQQEINGWVAPQLATVLAAQAQQALVADGECRNRNENGNTGDCPAE